MHICQCPSIQVRVRVQVIWQLLKICAICALWLCGSGSGSGCAAATAAGTAEGLTYRRYLSESRIKELRNLAQQVHESVNHDRYACDSYYDYVCSRNRPLYSILGTQPQLRDIMQLQKELQDDASHFEAKQKLADFFISCNRQHSVDDCYRQTFDYFKPLYAYVVIKQHKDTSRTHKRMLELLQRFLKKCAQNERLHKQPFYAKLNAYRLKFEAPEYYFQPETLNSAYADVRIYRESYTHNVRNLERHRRGNASYARGATHTMLNWSLYLYQSRNKPMSYFYATFNVHLWMLFYNVTERWLEPEQLRQQANCLKLPQFVTALDEATILALVYLRSLRSAWDEYHSWIISTEDNQDLYNQEDAVLRSHYLSNKRLFFTFYAQNFCHFGKELAESVFLLGLKQNPDFQNTYSCGYRIEDSMHCI